MLRIVERRPEEVVHSGVDDHECLRPRPFPVEHPGEQHGGVSRDHPTGLEDETGSGPANGLPHRRGVLRRTGGRLIGVPDPQPTADIDQLQGKAGGGQLPVELRDLGHRAFERSELGQLRADVAIHAARQHPLHPAAALIELGGLGEGHPELRGLQPRGNVPVGSRIDVGIYPDRERSGPFQPDADRVQSVQLLRAFHVEQKNSRLERHLHLRVGLADPGKDDLGRIGPRAKRSGKLASGDDVETRAEPGEEAEQ